MPESQEKADQDFVSEEEKIADQQVDRIERALISARNESINEAREKHDPRISLKAFVQEIARLFIQKKIDLFPLFCDVTRVQNIMKRRELEKTGYQGKYTGAFGFSKSGDDFFKYEIPKELYLFMANLVYKDFWSADNQAIADSFMHKIIRGDDPMTTLMWVKAIYGPNIQETKIVY